MHLLNSTKSIFKTIFSLICPLVLLAGSPQPYELDQGLRHDLPEGRLSKMIGTVNFDSDRAQLCGDVVPISNTRLIDMGIEKYFLDKRPPSNTFLVYETSFSGDIHPKVKAYSAIRMLIEGGTYKIDIGGMCYSMGFVADIFETVSGNKITGFVEGTWGFNNRFRLLEPIRLISTAGISLLKTWKSLSLDLSFGGAYRSPRDSIKKALDFNTLTPGHILFCSPEVIYSINPLCNIGVNAGVYLKGADFIENAQVASKDILGRGEVFYTWTPNSNLSLRFCYARSTQTRGLGMLGFKCAVRK